MNEVVFVMGYPASGKTQYSQKYIKKGYIHLNRDKQGGKLEDLLPLLNNALQAGKNVVLDNLFPTVESRKPFLKLVKDNKYIAGCMWMQTSIEDAQINALNRMYNKTGKLFLSPEDFKTTKDPNIFPGAVLFKYRKDFKAPNKSEGFNWVEKPKFVREYDPTYTNEAVIFDYDGTLRVTKPNSTYDFPTRPEEVELLPNRIEKLKSIKGLILGVSNQSGIAKDQVTKENAIKCFERTNELLGTKIDYVFCPHRIPPLTCYCRKPQSGLGVLLIHKYKLDPRKCTFVGDQTTDKSFAQRLGMNYVDQKDYF